MVKIRLGHETCRLPTPPQPERGYDSQCRRSIGDSAIRIDNATNPQVVVLGGILSTTRNMSLYLLRETLQPMLFPDTGISMEVLPARHPLSIPLCGGYDSCI